MGRPSTLDHRGGIGGDMVRLLNNRRIDAGLSISELSRAMDCSHHAARKLLQGVTHPTLAHLEDLAQALGMRLVVYLVEDDE
jgi:transcriptional regulator with XRE-family HTH domain